MLPAIWMAFKEAGIAWQVGTVAAIVLVPTIAYNVGYWRGASVGEQKCEDRHAQLALKHAQQAIDHTAKQSQVPVGVVEGLLKDQQENTEVIATLTKKLDAYQREREQKKQEVRHVERDNASTQGSEVCVDADPLDTQFMDRWNDIGRMFFEAGSPDNMSTSDRDSEGTAGVHTEDTSTTTVLRARQDDMANYKDTVDHYNRAKQFMLGNYIFQEAWRKHQLTEEK